MFSMQCLPIYLRTSSSQISKLYDFSLPKFQLRKLGPLGIAMQISNFGPFICSTLETE